MRMHSFFKTLITILIVVSLTYTYGLYQRKKYYIYDGNGLNELVLKKLPLVTTQDVYTGLDVVSSNLLSGSNGLFVHIWGSWCAPCEKEMPEFLNYARILEPQGLKFLLIAVNDEEFKVKKFMARFGILPKNVIIALDKENKVMDLFGSMKVPETFLFETSGRHVNKFIGPQGWSEPSYITRLNTWLNLSGMQVRKIETH